MTSTTIGRGNVLLDTLVAVTLSPSSVAPNTSAEQTFTIKGVRATDVIAMYSKPTNQAGLAIVNARVSAVDTVAIAFMNCTAATITPTASEVYTFEFLRPESPTSLPNDMSA